MTLVTAVQEMYRKLQAVKAWTGPTLPELNGNPLTHDILSALNLLDMDQHGGEEIDNCQGFSLESSSYSDSMHDESLTGSSSGSETRSLLHTTSEVPSTPTEMAAFGPCFYPNGSLPPTLQNPVPPQTLDEALWMQICAVSDDPLLYQAEWGSAYTSTEVPVINPSFVM